MRPTDNAQEIQDSIFRRMSADERVAFGASLWKLAKDLVGDKISYASHRSSRTTRRNSKNLK